jgi:hypothetical protein
MNDTGMDMRKLMLLVGVILLLAGVIAESMYVVASRVAYSGLVADIYLTTGVFFIILGFILMLASVRIPKLRVP